MDTASAKYELSRSCTRTSYAAAVDDASCEIVTVTVDASYASPDVSVPTTSIVSTGSTSSNDSLDESVPLTKSTSTSNDAKSPATLPATSRTIASTSTTMSSSPVVAPEFTIWPRSNVARSFTPSLSSSLKTPLPPTAIALPVIPPSEPIVAETNSSDSASSPFGMSTTNVTSRVPSRTPSVASYVSVSPTAASRTPVNSPLPVLPSVLAEMLLVNPYIVCRMLTTWSSLPLSSRPVVPCDVYVSWPVCVTSSVNTPTRSLSL